MAIREVLTYPNRTLFKKSSDVIEFNEKLHELLDDMYDTMTVKDGVGLAAIQIGVLKNVLIINPINDETKVQEKEDLIEAINPKITAKNGEQTYQEGCLSVPGFYEDIKRYQQITVEYFDRFGNLHIEEYSDFLAVAWQHEIDHLLGHLFIEKLSILKRKKFEKELKEGTVQKSVSSWVK